MNERLPYNDQKAELQVLILERHLKQTEFLNHLHMLILQNREEALTSLHEWERRFPDAFLRSKQELDVLRSLAQLQLRDEDAPPLSNSDGNGPDSAA